MRKKVGIIKRVLCIGLVFLLSINSFAAIVSDNDGSAFITKAEFDALKSSFQAQIDTYNQSIDSKIDGAIAAYLAGIQISQITNLDSMINNCSGIKFIPNWTIGQTLGMSTRSTGFVQIASIGGKGSSSTYMQLKMMSGNYDYPIEQTYPTSSTPASYSKLLKISQSLANNAKYTISDVIQSHPIFCLAVFWMSFDSTISTSSSYFSPSPSSVTISKSASETTIGAYPTSLSMRYGMSSSVTLTGFKTYAINDTSLSNNSQYLAGGAVPTSSVPAVKDTEINLLGNSAAFVHATTGWKGVYVGSTLYDDGNTNSVAPNYGGYAYNHKISNVYYTDLLIDKISSVSGKDTYYYSGMPLFRATRTGIVKFKIKATNSASGTTTIQIKDNQFSNTAITAGSGSLNWTLKNASGGTVSSWQLSNNVEYSIEGPVNTDTMYWIKANPSSGNSSLQTIGDIQQIAE